MKKYLWLSLLFLGLSFFLSGLQGSLYFFPIPMPAFWFIILTFYSFRKGLLFTLLLNIPHTLILASFASIPIGKHIFLINLVSFAFYFIRERFHTSHWHVILGASGGLLAFLSSSWFIEGFQSWHWPPVMQWIGLSVSTFIFAPPLVFVLDQLDQKIEYERIDTLENLRI